MRELNASIIFELVLIGFQVLIWVSLLVLAVFGYQWLNLASLNEWSTQLSFALLGVAYMFGLIFEKAVSALPYSWIIGGAALPSTGDSPQPLQLRMEILARRPEVYEVLERRINQHRLVRSTVFNLALISLAALVFLIAQIGLNLRLLVVLIFLSLLFVGLALFTGRRSARTLNFELLHASNAVNAAEQKAADRLSAEGHGD